MMNPFSSIVLFFGGRSVEHDVSVLTGLSVWKWLKKSVTECEVGGVYIDRQGNWHYFETIPSFSELRKTHNTPSNVKVILSPESRKMELETIGYFSKKHRFDVVFPAFHGTYGEDGAFQGLLEILAVPYVGCDVTSSAIAMDKDATKRILAAHGLPQVKFMTFLRDEIMESIPETVTLITKELPYFPLFVKPANLGSSIGISKADNAQELENAIEVAFCYSHKIVVEQGITELREINCAVRGYKNDIEASLLEQPVSNQEFLNFDEKYVQSGGTMGGGIESKVKIPAPLSDDLTKKIQDLAIQTYTILGCSGTARIDFLVDKEDQAYVNEINPLPGTLHMHLWKKSGVDIESFLNQLLFNAFEKYLDVHSNLTEFETPLLLGEGFGLKTGIDTTDDDE